MGRMVQEGISVRFSMTQMGGDGTRDAAFFEDDHVRFRFRLTDTASGAPLTSVYPAAWLVAREPGTETRRELAERKAEALVNANVFSPADLDLNVYYVLTLNSNATVTVVDPLFGYGSTKLLALIQLKTPGADWALTEDESTLFVSLPESNEVAVIDTMRWGLQEYIPGGRIPDRMALQPDGHYLWVAGGGYGEQAADSGVTVIRTDTLEIAGRIRTGRGRHDLAFSDDSRYAFVSNRDENTVTVIDVRTLGVRADVPTAKTPVSIAYSSAGEVAYVTHADGVITVVSAERRRVIGRLEAETGLGQIKFAPDGRFAFVVNPLENLIHIIDAAAGRIVQSASLSGCPDQITFSDEMAYIRRRESAVVKMVPLDAIGKEGAPIPMVEFPAGQSPAGTMSRPCHAPTMVQAPGASAMLVANPIDQAVYFYKEGMSAPMGTFSNYGREPLAVTVVDRSLSERHEAGTYETVAQLRDAGSYDVIFFLDAPRIVHCFPIDIRADPEKERQRNEGRVSVEHVVDARVLSVGKTNRVGFRLTDLSDGQPRSGLSDVTIQTYLVPNWHQRYLATETEPGIYSIDFQPPQPGVYYISLSSPAAKLTHDDPHMLILKGVIEAQDSAEVD